MMNPTRSFSGLVLASLTLAAVPAWAGELEPLGDTALEAADRDEYVARSSSLRPGVRHDGGALRVAFDPADHVELETVVAIDGTPGTVSLSFDGRLLTARDLTREQTYRMAAGATFEAAYSFELFRGGVRVATADAVDGVAPFVLEGLDGAGLVHRVDAAPDGHGGQIDLHSWSLGTWNATFDGGGSLVVDHVVVRAHEIGHVVTLGYGATRVQASGAEELRVGAEDLIVAEPRDVTVAIADVASVFLVAAPGATPRTTRFTPPAGYAIRLRSGRDGAKLGAWSAWSTSATLVSPAPAGDEAVDDLEVELQRAGTPTVAIHGYVKIKKLNSGG